MSIDEELIEELEDLKTVHRDQFGGDLPDRSPLAEAALAWGIEFLRVELERGWTYSDSRGVTERRAEARDALGVWLAELDESDR